MKERMRIIDGERRKPPTAGVSYSVQATWTQPQASGYSAKELPMCYATASEFFDTEIEARSRAKAMTGELRSQNLSEPEVTILRHKYAASADGVSWMGSGEIIQEIEVLSAGTHP